MSSSVGFSGTSSLFQTSGEGSGVGGLESFGFDSGLDFWNPGIMEVIREKK